MSEAKEYEYQGWKITHDSKATQLGYRSHLNDNVHRSGKGRFVSAWFVHYPEGGTKTVGSLAAAKKYINEYNGWTS